MGTHFSPLLSPYHILSHFSASATSKTAGRICFALILNFIILTNINNLVALLSGDEKEIYKALYKKKEIDDKTPKLRTEDEKNMLKSLSNKMRYFPKDFNMFFSSSVLNFGVLSSIS